MRKWKNILHKEEQIQNNGELSTALDIFSRLYFFFKSKINKAHF